MNKCPGDELGVKSGSKNGTFAHENGAAIVSGENFDMAAYPDYLGRTYENAFNFPDAGKRRGDRRPEAVDLGTISVAADRDVEAAQAGLTPAFDILREEDEAGAGAENGHALLDPLPEGLKKAEALEERAHHGGLAAWDDDGIGFFQVGCAADF